MIPPFVLESIPDRDRSIIFESIRPADLYVRQLSDGFSRNGVWNVQHRDTKRNLRYAIRNWNCQTYSQRQLEEILHFQLTLALKENAVPKPVRWLYNEWVINSEDTLWTLEEWRPGESLASNEVASDHLLEQISMVLSSLHGAGRQLGVKAQKSKGIAERIQKIESWRLQATQQSLDDFLQAFVRKLLRSDSHEAAVAQACDQIDLIKAGLTKAFRCIHEYGDSWLYQLQSVQARLPECHWVMRDLWRENILVAHGKLSGIIDFGASRMDWPWLEVVRCLSSFLLPHDPRWEWMIDNYQRCLDACDIVSMETIRLLDQVGTSLSLLYWYNQVVLELIDTSDRGAHRVYSRIENLSSRTTLF